MLCKIYGTFDLLAACILFFGFYTLPNIIKIAIIFVMLVKGIPSLAADTVGKLYGIIDLTAAFLIYSGGLPIPEFIKIITVFILVFKGVPSLLG